MVRDIFTEYSNGNNLCILDQEEHIKETYFNHYVELFSNNVSLIDLLTLTNKKEKLASPCKLSNWKLMYALPPRTLQGSVLS